MARLTAFLAAAALALVALPPALCLGAAMPTGSARALLQTRASCPLVGGSGAYAREEINMPSETCRNGGANYKNNAYCEACYLYERFSEKASGTFVATGTPAQDHYLVLPVQPCSGVEMYSAPACGGDAILDNAYGQLSGPQKASKGLGANGNHRRTQHQMHLHVADVQPDLLAALRTVQTGAGWKTIACDKGRAANCKVTADPVTDRTPIAAQCVAASSPAAARPFETVYATPNDVIYSAMVVASPRQGEICIVRATDRPVECLTDCASECQTKC